MKCLSRMQPAPDRQDEFLVENWRGKVVPPEKRTDFYKSPVPDWRYRNIVASDDRLAKISSLKNANSLKSVKVKVVTVSISNSCAFDAILTGLTTAVFNSESYRTLAVAHKDNCSLIEVAEFLFSNKGSSFSAAYRMRADALLAAFPQEQCYYNVMTIDCACTAAEAARRLLPDATCFSVSEQDICENSSCSYRERKNNFVVLQVDQSHLTPQLTNLAGALQLPSFRLPNKAICSYCARFDHNDEVVEFSRTKSVVEFGSHLIIEMPATTRSANVSRRFSGHSVEVTARYPLSCVPPYLELLQPTTSQLLSYKLRCVVEFQAPAADTAIGHYDAICYRGNGVRQRLAKGSNSKRSAFISDRTWCSPNLFIYTL